MDMGLSQDHRDRVGKLEAMLPEVYRELRALAYQLFEGQRGDHTLQPTALVHEVYLRLAGQDGSQEFTRSEFVAAAARMIRYILVDHARARQAVKRGGGRKALPLEESIALAPENDIDFLALDEAMSKLAEFDARKAKLVELRFFGGLTIDETAEALGISPRSLYREWEVTKAWLTRELGKGDPDDS
jgi:RNA polymerase sigma factor (TIGR02999 family)